MDWGLEHQMAVRVVAAAGPTTAATFWATASVGLAVGYGMYMLGTLVSLIVFGLLAAHHLPGWDRLTCSPTKVPGKSSTTTHGE